MIAPPCAAPEGAAPAARSPRTLLDRERAVRRHLAQGCRISSWLSAASQLLEQGEPAGTAPLLAAACVPAVAHAAVFLLPGTGRAPIVAGEEGLGASAVVGAARQLQRLGSAGRLGALRSRSKLLAGRLGYEVALWATVSGAGGGAVLLLSRDQGSYAGASGRGLAARLAARLAAALGAEQGRAAAHQAVKAREERLAAVAHDLATPIGTMLLTASALLSASASGGPVPSLQPRLEILVRASGRMRRLQRDLLDLGAIENGDLTLHRGLHPTAALLAEAVDSQEPEAASRAISLATEERAQSGAVFADRERVLQVLQHLVGNALRFTPGGGTVRLRARRARGDVEIAVADSGEGIASQDLPHVFERHFRGGARAAGGAGLGLYIARGIVESHGGRIWAESRPGNGSTFLFTLPAAAPRGICG